jgi:hypothetical protein
MATRILKTWYQLEPRRNDVTSVPFRYKHTEFSPAGRLSCLANYGGD